MADDFVVSKYRRETFEMLAEGMDALNSFGPDGVEDFLHYLAERGIADYKKAFDNGERGAVLGCIRLCLFTHVDVPPWAAQAFIDAVSAGEHGKIKSWNDVFGRPKTKGAVERAERDLAYAHEVIHAINHVEQPKDDRLFARVGRLLGVGGATKVKELYARGRGELNPEQLRRVFEAVKVRASETTPPKSRK